MRRTEPDHRSRPVHATRSRRRAGSCRGRLARRGARGTTTLLSTLLLVLPTLVASAVAQTLVASHLTGVADPRTPLRQRTTPGDDSVVRITKPGSYCLTRNLTGRSGQAGNEVAASNVSIDLMGFRLAGGPGTLDGIVAVGSGLSFVEVFDGAVVGWGEDGVDLGLVLGAGVRRVTAATNAGDGIVLGADERGTDANAYGNAGGGVSAATVRPCGA